MDENWEYIGSQINPSEDEDAEEEGQEPEEGSEEEIEGDEEEDEEELLEEGEPDLTKPNPRTDLYTGRPRG